jgi:hypothetical protein
MDSPPTKEIKMKANWTRQEVETMLEANERAVARGVVRLYCRQEAGERVSGTVTNDNGMGFSGCNARSGTYYAKWVISGGILSGKHLEKARKICLHHVGQLTGVANGDDRTFTPVPKI